MCPQHFVPAPYDPEKLRMLQQVFDSTWEQFALEHPSRNMPKRHFDYRGYDIGIEPLGRSAFDRGALSYQSSDDIRSACHGVLKMRHLRRCGADRRRALRLN
jgi:hypothetical protein